MLTWKGPIAASVSLISARLGNLSTVLYQLSCSNHVSPIIPSPVEFMSRRMAPRTSPSSTTKWIKLQQTILHPCHETINYTRRDPLHTDRHQHQHRVFSGQRNSSRRGYTNNGSFVTGGGFLLPPNAFRPLASSSMASISFVCAALSHEMTSQYSIQYTVHQEHYPCDPRGEPVTATEPAIKVWPRV